MLAGLVVALILVVVAVLVASLGAVGVAAIGWLLHRWFDLTEWQGSLIALAVALGVGYVTFRMAYVSEAPDEPEWLPWEEVDDETPNGSEPPVVPWRRQRPTQGDLPTERSQQKSPRRK